MVFAACCTSPKWTKIIIINTALINSEPYYCRVLNILFFGILFFNTTVLYAIIILHSRCSIMIIMQLKSKEVSVCCQKLLFLLQYVALHKRLNNVMCIYFKAIDVQLAETHRSGPSANPSTTRIVYYWQPLTGLVIMRTCRDTLEEWTE